MIAHNSPLKKLPAGVDRKQALFIDGIRHAAEIASLAYSRLRETLTHIALSELNEKDKATYSTAAFLDAWAFVDAIDRFRMLWQQMPLPKTKQPITGVPPLEEVMKPFRELRNVADHIAQRIDEVLSKHSAALGILSWFTATDVNPVQGYMCSIIPGTVTGRRVAAMPSPVGRSLEFRTVEIWLEAGGYKACLCDVIPHVALRIKRLEESVAAKNLELKEDGPYADSDLIVKASVSFPD